MHALLVLTDDLFAPSMVSLMEIAAPLWAAWQRRYCNMSVEPLTLTYGVALQPARYSAMVGARPTMTLAETITAIAALGCSAIRRFARYRVSRPVHLIPSFVDVASRLYEAVVVCG